MLGSSTLARVLAAPPEPPPWASLRWLAGVDLRVLWAILALALALALLGVWTGWRAPRTDDADPRRAD